MLSLTKTGKLDSLLEMAWRDHRTTTLWHLDAGTVLNRQYAAEVARLLKRGSARSYVLGRRIESLLAEEGNGLNDEGRCDRNRL